MISEKFAEGRLLKKLKKISRYNRQAVEMAVGEVNRAFTFFCLPEEFSRNIRCFQRVM